MLACIENTTSNAYKSILRSLLDALGVGVRMGWTVSLFLDDVDMMTGSVAATGLTMYQHDARFADRQAKSARYQEQ